MQSDGCHLKSGAGQIMYNNMGEGSWWNLDSPTMAQYRSLFPSYTASGSASASQASYGGAGGSGSATAPSGSSTVQSATGATGTASYSAAPTPPSCPGANNTVYTVPSTGSRFLIQCGIDAQVSCIGDRCPSISNTICRARIFLATPATRAPLRPIGSAI